MSFQPPPGGPPPPPGGMPGPQQPWPQQQPWSPGPPPKKRGNGWKWALGGVALLAVIGVTAAVTISVTRDGDDDPTPTGDTFGLASADDNGPANIITEDPSCAAWRRINGTLADSQRGWVDRDPSIPASAWTPEQRSQYEVVGRAMREAADQSVSLAKLTPHRVVRELYEQFIAYARAYSDAISSYTAIDNHLVGVALTSSGALTFACTAIEWGSAQAWAPLVTAPAPPSEFAPLTDPSNPQRFLSTEDSICEEWSQSLDQYTTDTAASQALDANVAASEWSPEQRRIVDAVIPVMTQHADNLERLGRSSSNPVIQDFAVLAAQYRRAYVAAVPTYTSADSYLSRASNRASTTINEACKAVGS